jgi:hypothetical protein
VSQIRSGMTKTNDLPSDVVEAIASGHSMAEAVLHHIARRFGNLILMKPEGVDIKRPLAEFGMDSMLGAELRTWFYQTFKVNVSMLVLLNSTSSLETLRDVALKQMLTNSG